MIKVYYKKDRIKYGILWMLIFAGAAYAVMMISFPGNNWVSAGLIVMAILSLITGISGTNDDSKSPIGLGCPKCKEFHPLINININEDSSIYMYGENCFRTREEDGLNIYPFLCFKCKQVTEYASDSNNQSGHAVCGFEYFKSKKATKTDINNATEYAKLNNHDHVLKKLKNVKVSK